MAAAPPVFDVVAFLKQQSAMVVLKYQTNQIVFSQGDAANSVFYIQAGRVKVTVVSDYGKEAVVAIQGPDEFCGEDCLIGRSLRLATVTTMSECDIVRLEKPTAVRLIHDEPEFSQFLLSHLLVRNAKVESDLVDQLFNSSEKRLARALLLLANVGKDNGPHRIPVTVTQELLADMIGTTRSRVSFFMNKFRKLGLIDYNGHVDVNNALLDVVLHDNPHIAKDTE